MADIAIFSTAALLLIHHVFFINKAKEWSVILCFACVGFSFDLLLSALGLIMFSSFPLWLFCLWISFATCLNHALRIFHSRLRLLLVLTVFFIPLNYYLGALFTATLLVSPVWIVLMAITVFWLLLLSMAIKQSKNIETACV
jgi:hypothetical protein